MRMRRREKILSFIYKNNMTKNLIIKFMVGLRLYYEQFGILFEVLGMVVEGRLLIWNG